MLRANKRLIQNVILDVICEVKITVLTENGTKIKNSVSFSCRGNAGGKSINIW